jgi:hypothetical protein
METDCLREKLDQLLETLAAIEHERWSHWQRSMHSKCVPRGNDGALLIPADLVRPLENQIAIPYSDLPEEQKGKRSAVSDSLILIERVAPS